MGKMLLIVVVSAGVIFSLISLNMNTSNTEMVTNSVQEYESVHAKNNAAAGIELAIKNLSVDTAWAGVNKRTLYQGNVSITVQNTQSRYFNGPNEGLIGARLVTSTGLVGDQTHIIRAVIQLPTSSGPPGKVPPFLTYAIASGEDFALTGNVQVRDDFNPLWNANVHTNKNFRMTGNPTIKGFLSYTGTASSTPGHRLNTNIKPNVNLNGDPVHFKSPEIEIPDFNPEDYIGLATHKHMGNYSVSGNLTLGTKDNPSIIYVGGNLTLNGNVKGYGVFIVKGTTTINGNVNILGIDPTSSNLGLYSKGNINMNGNVTVKAQLLSSEDINLNGNVSVHGSMAAQGKVNFNGNVGVYYRPAADELSSPFWKTGGGGTIATRPVILSYYE